MNRLASRLMHALADWLHPPPAQSNIEFIAALKREFEESQRKPLTPEQRIAVRVSMLPNDIQRSPHLLCVAIMKIEQEIEAEYGPSAASREIAREIAAANRPTAFTRRLRSVR